MPSSASSSSVPPPRARGSTISSNAAFIAPAAREAAQLVEDVLLRRDVELDRPARREPQLVERRTSCGFAIATLMTPSPGANGIATTRLSTGKAIAPTASGSTPTREGRPAAARGPPRASGEDGCGSTECARRRRRRAAIGLVSSTGSPASRQQPEVGVQESRPGEEGHRSAESEEGAERDLHLPGCAAVPHEQHDRDTSAEIAPTISATGTERPSATPSSRAA